ncbi:hypothetical protein BV898_03464 [Hypsibius exemplaris]|uniref:Uncharacterized protein n=1 Tax=Hypsibius exemplaris TaxID=2072580 RepID=A0A1W0X545_HYPEX|nr:hypothetical protein BV898_03464 [Hypsibius exemplaris]
MLKLTSLLVLVAFTVVSSQAERISNVESPTWGRRTTEGYGFGSSSGDRSPTFEGDSESIRPYGSPESGRRYTQTWERDSAAGSVTRSSYLDRFTTQRPGSSYDRDSDAYGYVSSRRPSYQTDRWGDAVGGDRTTPRSPYESVYGSRTTQRSPYGSVYDRDTTRSYASLFDRDTTSRYGSYGGSGSRTTARRFDSNGWSDRDSVYGSGSGLGSGRDRDSYDPNNAYVHIEAELVKLTNEKGLTSTGARCDTFGACDTVCYGYLDTERPNAEFPGSRDQKYWPKLFETDDNNSPSFSRANVTREVCGAPYREATFRVACEDRDSINSNDLINKWDCNIQRSPEGETFATWHAGTCTPKFQADKMTLISGTRSTPFHVSVATDGGSYLHRTRNSDHWAPFLSSLFVHPFTDRLEFCFAKKKQH